MTSFSYHKPETAAAAAELLNSKSDAAFLAGGMTLLPTLKNRLREVSDLIDLGGVAALKSIARMEGGLRIGAMATHGDIAASADVRAYCAALAEFAAQIGDPQVRNRGTIGGSIANNDPAADWPAALLACNARVETSAGMIAAEDFFTGMFETALAPGAVIEAVQFPPIASGAYAKFRHPASGYAVAGVFVARNDDGVRVAVTGAVSQVQRWSAAEAALAADFSVQSVASLAFDSDAIMGDIHASGEYRAHLVAVLLRRAVTSILR